MAMATDPDEVVASADVTNVSKLLGDLSPLKPASEVPERFGDYEVDRVIARGTHGVVFKATDAHGIQVAIKWLRKRRDESELSTYVQLSKTVNGLPPILSSGVKEDRTYFVLPYYERRSLRFRLRKLQFPQSVDETMRIAGAFTELLGELHRHGFTHADFKPDNLLIEAVPSASEHTGHSLLRDDERLVLSDFGTIRSADGFDQFGEGTPGYAAPELRTNLIDHDPRVDVYAASATVVECMTGIAPAQVRTPTDSVFDPRVLARTAPLESALRKGFSFDPDQRQATVSDWFDDLLAAADSAALLSGVQPSSRAGTVSSAATISNPAFVEPLESAASQKHVGSTKKDDAAGAKTQRQPGLLSRFGRSTVSTVGLVGLILAGYWLLTQTRIGGPWLIGADGNSDAATQSDETLESDAILESDSAPQPEAPAQVELSAPLVLETVADPRWGTPRMQLTAVDSQPVEGGQSDGARYHRINSTSRSVISNDERWILAHRDGQWTVVDRTNGQFKPVNIEQESQPTWHPAEPATILHLDLDGMVLLATTVEGVTTVAADLGDRVVAEVPSAAALRAPRHGEPSADGWRYAWVVVDDAGDLVGFVTYDLAADAVLGVHAGVPSGDIGRFDSIAISKGGDEVVVAFADTYVIFEEDFTGEWRIGQRPFSYELALSGQGEDVLVVANFDSSAFGVGWIVAHNLESGEPARLLNLYDGSDSDVQFSGLATEKPGWVLASTHDCADQESWSCDRIMALNIDDATVIDLAETNSCAEVSFSIPTATVNRDFTKAWFNSDFGSCGEDAVIVELTIDQLGGEP